MRQTRMKGEQMERVHIETISGYRCPECGQLNAIEPIRGDEGEIMPYMDGDEYTCDRCGTAVCLRDVK